MRTRRPRRPANNSSGHEKPQQIVIRPQAKPQFTWFDFVALGFLSLMVFFAVQSIAGMSLQGFKTEVWQSLDAANQPTFSVTNVASPEFHNLVPSRTLPAPAEPVVAVVTATEPPALRPATTPTPLATQPPTATAILTPFVNLIYESPVDAARGHKCTEETPCNNRPQRPSEGRP